MHRAPTGVLVLSLAFTTVACSTTPPPGSTATVVDSAGIPIVRVDGLDEVRAPHWTLTKVVDTRSDNIDLFRVVGARILESGSVAIANSGEQQILVLDSRGKLKRQLGGNGEGPGEFRRLVGIVAPGGDSIVGYDSQLLRRTVFDGNGEVVETRPLHPPRTGVDLLPLAETPGGGVLAVYGEMRLFLNVGLARDSVPLLVLTDSGTVRDTLGIWEGKEYYYQMIPTGGVSRTNVGFSRNVVHAGRNGLAVVGSTDSVDLTVFSGSGRVVLGIRGSGGRPIPAEVLKDYREEREKGSERAPADQQAQIRNTPVHDTYPAMAGVAISDQGEIWVGTYAPEPTRRRDWIVFARTGETAGRVTLPVESTVLDVAGDQVILLERNDVEEEYVTVWRIDRGS